MNVESANLALHALHLRREGGHGSGCECLALAAAAHCDPRHLSFGFCLHVLQTRWVLVCHHGEIGECPHPALANIDWRQFGKLDAVKAVLVSNA